MIKETVKKMVFCLFVCFVLVFFSLKILDLVGFTGSTSPRPAEVSHPGIIGKLSDMRNVTFIKPKLSL